MSISDMQGRGLEYVLTQTIFDQLKHLCNETNFTPQATKRQEDDKHNYDELTTVLKKYYDKCSGIIAKWLIDEKIGSEGIENILIDKLSDQAGVDSDVTDLRISLTRNGETQDTNISLKHRHLALKHPRLTRVPGWILIDDTEIVSEYKESYDAVWDDFISKATEDYPDAVAFNSVKDSDEDFINDNLYTPLCSLVKQFLDDNISEPEQVEHLFQFLVGKYSFLKIIVFDDRIEIIDFSNIALPTSIEISLRDKSYLVLTFDNGWIITLRLHTASTNIDSKSVKFDAQCPSLSSILPTVTIPTD